MTNSSALYQVQKSYFKSRVTYPLAFRKAQLRKLKHLILLNEKKVYTALKADFQKSEFEAFVTELGGVVKSIDLHLKKMKQWSKPQRVKSGLANFPSSSYIYREPYGVCLIIAPWNYPFLLALEPLVAAIAAGNCAVIKPSELTTNTSALLAKIINESFLKEYLRVVEGGVEETTELLQQPFHKIYFTGSSRVGKIVMKAAAEHLTPVTLELGGKSPCVVDEDASIELAAKRIAWGKFLNAGQTCIAPDYLLVHHSIKKEFISALKTAILELYGNNPQSNPDFQRIINKAHFQRINKLMTNEKIAHGGEVDSKENYIAPTLLDSITSESPIMQEEVFGPVLPILSFREVAEVEKQIGNHPTPLAFYYFGKQNTEHFLQNIEFGGACINDTISHLVNHNLPFGGKGASGMGKSQGKHSFDTFSHQKGIVKRGTWLDIPLRYAPYQGKLKWLKRLLPWL